MDKPTPNVRASGVWIDGSQGEGGGQVLRTSLSLAAITGRPVIIERIRARRKKPGLRRQHLTGVLATQRITAGHVEGAELGSDRVALTPNTVLPGTYAFDVGTAGSASLVLQTILPPLLLASGPSHVVLDGGTHNSMSPPFDFMQRVFLPLIGRMGPRVDVRLERHGFFPKGGGRFVVDITPSERLEPLELLSAGPLLSVAAEAIISRLPTTIGDRQMAVVERELDWRKHSLATRAVKSKGPGCALLLFAQREGGAELITGFGEKGVPAERIALQATRDMAAWLATDAPVGRHLADQLLIPMALAGSGAFRTPLPLGPHTTTNMRVIETFLKVCFSVTEDGDTAVIRVTPAVSA